MLSAVPILSKTLPYVPSWTNFTIGASTFGGQYTRLGRWIEFEANLILGTGFSITNSPICSLPVTALFAPIESAFEAMFIDVGSNNYEGGCFEPTTTTAGRTMAFSSNSTYSNAATVQAGVPFTWVAGDIIQVIGHYLAAEAI